ncbi:hypothetical protein Droror1_Dr00011626 [Drosera rotundifolia]
MPWTLLLAISDHDHITKSFDVAVERVGFSAVPPTLYVPPVRTLTLFVEAMEELVRETEVFVHGRYCRRLWVAAVRMLSCVLPR